MDGYETPLTVDITYDEAEHCFVGNVWLRAERDGRESGRTYSIVTDVFDPQGNMATASCVVVVPHGRRKK